MKDVERFFTQEVSLSILQQVKEVVVARNAADAGAERVRKSLLEETKNVGVETCLAEKFIEAILLANGKRCTVKLVDNSLGGGCFLKEGPHLKYSALKPLRLSFEQYIGFGKVEGLTGFGYSQLAALLETLQSHGFIVESVIVSEEEDRFVERVWNKVITFTLIW